MQLGIFATLLRGALALLLASLSACERAKPRDDPPTAPGQTAPTPTGLAEAYIRVVRSAVGPNECPVNAASPVPTAWLVEFDPSTPLTSDNKANITFEVDKGPIDVATDAKLPSIVHRSSRLSWPGPSGRVRLFCEYDMVGTPQRLVRYRPVGTCAGFADQCLPSYDFVDPYEIVASQSNVDHWFTKSVSNRFFYFASDGIPAWNIPAVGYVESYRRMRTLLTRAVSQRRDISIESLLGTFEALGDEPTRKRLSERGSLKFVDSILVSAASKRMEAVVADVVLKQNVTFAIPATVKIEASQPTADSLQFKFIDRPLVIFESLPPAFGDLRRFEVTEVRLLRYESEIYLKDPFSDRIMILRSIYRAQPLTVSKSETSKGSAWINW